MLIKDILKTKGPTVYTISVDAVIADVVKELVAHNIGSLVVRDGETIAGIITERDILRTVAEVKDPLETIPVTARMTANVISGSPDDEVGQVMGLMVEKRMRHLPVLESGELVGLVSIGDVVKAHHARLTMENHYMMNYIQS
ncbi:MAG: CBS domain-containing protein [Pirellulaceae bacterium]